MLWNKQSSEKKKKSNRLHKISYSFSFIFISVNSQNVRTIGGFWCHFPVFSPASKVLILLKFRVTMRISRMDVETFCPIISLTYKLSVNHSYINSQNWGCGDFFSSLSKFRHFFRRISEIRNVGDLMHVRIGSSWPRLILWNIWKTTEQMPLQTLKKTLKDKFETIILLRLCYVLL